MAMIVFRKLTGCNAVEGEERAAKNANNGPRRTGQPLLARPGAFTIEAAKEKRRGRERHESSLTIDLENHHMPGMIVAPQPLAVEEGAKVLAVGGNAFDAALTAATVQFLVDPHSCGVGGYLVMTCKPAGSTEPGTIVDAPALAGSRTSTDMWKDIVIGPNPRGWGYFLEGKVNEDGCGSGGSR